MTIQKLEVSQNVDNLLSCGKPGDEITVIEMTNIVRMPCSNSEETGWKVVARSIPRVEHQYDLYWRWIRDRKVWRCLTDEEKPAELNGRLKSIRRQAVRTRRMGQSVDMVNLTPEQKLDLSTNIMVVGVVEIITSRSAVKKVKNYASTTFLPSEQDLIEVIKKRTGASQQEVT